MRSRCDSVSLDAYQRKGRVNSMLAGLLQKIIRELNKEVACFTMWLGSESC